MDKIILPARLSDSWFDAETLSHLRRTLAPLDTDTPDQPIALMAAAHLGSLVRIDPVVQVVLSGTTGGLPPNPHRLMRIMDVEEPRRAPLALSAVALHSDPDLPIILHLALEMRAGRDVWADIYITRDAILMLNAMGEWDQAVQGPGRYADEAFRRCALCLLPRPGSAHQALEQHRAVRGLGALAEMDVTLSPTETGHQRRLLDPELRPQPAN